MAADGQQAEEVPAGLAADAPERAAQVERIGSRLPPLLEELKKADAPSPDDAPQAQLSVRLSVLVQLGCEIGIAAVDK